MGTAYIPTMPEIMELTADLAALKFPDTTKRTMYKPTQAMCSQLFNPTVPLVKARMPASERAGV